VAIVRIAVVIPALDEADRIEAAIASTRPNVAPETGTRIFESEIDIVVADGGSRDRTADRARAAGARVVTAPRGRALQLEHGWRATEGEVVLFLHADTELPAGWATHVRDALADPRVAGGAFRLSFRERSLGLAIVAWGANLRSRWAGLPYGDQALFARREALAACGGVPPVAIAEDLDLVRALAREGRIELVDAAVVTSARRYLAGGVLRTWWRHAIALVAWRLGVDRAWIARWVRS
jgi:rSAM/selenodomain-associated transferase 2